MKTDSLQNSEPRTQNPAENRGPPQATGGERSWMPWILLVAAILAYYGVMNILYFRQNGWLATHGSDIWFFLSFARGLQALSPFDLTYWIVRPIGMLAPEQGFATLIGVSIYLHTISSLLVYHYLGRILHLEANPRFLAAFLFAALPQNTLLSTASFTHFTVAQPLLIIAFARLLPWCLKQTRTPDVWGLVCLLETAVIGPEGWFLLFGLASIAASKRVDFKSKLKALKCPPAAAIFIACAILVVFFPLFYRIWNFFSLHVRGIDLLWQKDIRTGDLFPLGWKALTMFAGFHLVWLATAAYALWKRRFLPAFLILFFMTLNALVFRAFYILELAGFASLMFLISREDFRIGLHPRILLGTLAAWMLLFGLIPQKFAYLPPHLARVAKAILVRPKSQGMIACSPAYGFFFQAWTGRQTTDDLHKPPGTWSRLAAMRPMEADRFMKEKKIAFIVLTSWDFRPGNGGNWLSGGLDKTLQPLSNEDYRLSLVVRALTLNPPIIQPLDVIASEEDSPSKQRALCLTPSF